MIKMKLKTFPDKIKLVGHLYAFALDFATKGFMVEA